MMLWARVAVEEETADSETDRIRRSARFRTPAIEIGWWLIPSAWGCGFATEGAVAVRDEAFADLGLDRIVARDQPANVHSVRGHGEDRHAP